MKKREIIVGFLFPTNQQAARTVEPGMRAFHHPSPRAMAGKANVLGCFLTSTADMIEIAARSYEESCKASMLR